MGKRQSLSSKPSVAPLRENRADPFYIYTTFFGSAISEDTFLVMPWIALLQRLGVTSHSNSEGSSTHIEWYHSGFAVAWELEPVSPVSPILCHNFHEFPGHLAFRAKARVRPDPSQESAWLCRELHRMQLNRLHSVESCRKFLKVSVSRQLKISNLDTLETWYIWQSDWQDETWHW